jgi:hypothetical protein
MINNYSIKVKERIQCPEEFQQRINEVAGFNRYGEPNYKLVWAQTETQIQGGHWNNEDGSFTGYREILKGDGLPHWMLMQWTDAGKSAEMPHLEGEGPVLWYINNTDTQTGLSYLGEYPYHGSYQIVLTLCAKWFDDGKLCIEPMPLTTDILNLMIPIIEASMTVSLKAKLKYMEEEEEREEKQRVTDFEDMYRDIRINPNLCASWLEDKQRKIEQTWNSALVQKAQAMRSKGNSFQSNHQL